MTAHQAAIPPDMRERLCGDTILNSLIEIRRALGAARSAIKCRERWSESMANCFDGAFKALEELDAEIDRLFK